MTSINAVYVAEVGRVEQAMVTEMATVAKKLGKKVSVFTTNGVMVVRGLLNCDHEAQDVLCGKYGFHKVSD